MNNLTKIILAAVPTGFVILGGWYVVDRVFIKKAPLYPFSLKKAQEKQANDALSLAKSRLNALMERGDINGFGVVGDASAKKNYIEVSSDKVTTELRNEIPSSVKGIEIRLVERPMAKAL